MQDLGAVLPFIGIALLFWLLIIRPASKRQKAMATMQSRLAVGDEIVLTSGIYGRVASIDDDGVHVTVADGVTILVARAAVGSVVPAQTPDDDEPVADATEES